MNLNHITSHLIPNIGNTDITSPMLSTSEDIPPGTIIGIVVRNDDAPTDKDQYQ